MKTLYALGLIGVLVGTALALLSRSGQSQPIAPLLLGLKEKTAIAQPMIAPTAVPQTGTILPITTTSSNAAIALAKHLKRSGAKMYGAYWCPHCHEQLELFGQKATTQLPYIECAKDVKNSRPDLCKTAKIEGYPTWKIKGKTYLGTQPLDELATASGYKGSRNF
ncbi:MAG: hypothetical protein RBJ76_26795 [Stenomitos frigidus ULC029]